MVTAVSVRDDNLGSDFSKSLVNDGATVLGDVSLELVGFATTLVSSLLFVAFDFALDDGGGTDVATDEGLTDGGG